MRLPLLALATGLACGAPPPAPVARPSPASIPAHAAAPTSTPTSAPLTLTLVCRDIRRTSAGAELTGPLSLEIRNSGPAEEVIDEVTGFNLDLPDRVAHRSDANASFKLRRVGSALGSQGYSCAEATPAEPEKVRLKPGGVHVHPVAFYAVNSLPPGEYRAWVTYHPRKLEGTCRFKVVP